MFYKVIHNPVEEQQIIPDMRETIISEDDWRRIQKLRKTSSAAPTPWGGRARFRDFYFVLTAYFRAKKSLKPNPLKELERLMDKIYEDNALGKMSDDV